MTEDDPAIDVRNLRVAIEAVKGIGFRDGLRNGDAKFVCPFDVAGLSFTDEGNDPLTAPEGIAHPPVECGFMVNAIGYGKFGSFCQM